MLHGHHMKKRLSKNKSDIYFVYPGNINAKTGGYIYEKNILEYAKIRDINIRPIALSENYPFPTNNDIKYFLKILDKIDPCLLYTSPSPRDRTRSRMPSSA